MTADERAIERLRNPKPGGKIWAAKEYGIDLTQLIERLRQTPEERLKYAAQMTGFMRKWQNSARRTQ